MSDKKAAEPPREVDLSLVLGKIAQWAFPDLQGISCVIVRPSGIMVQGAGAMAPRELARALRAFADRLDEEQRRASLILVPDRHH